MPAARGTGGVGVRRMCHRGLSPWCGPQCCGSGSCGVCWGGLTPRRGDAPLSSFGVRPVSAGGVVSGRWGARSAPACAASPSTTSAVSGLGGWAAVRSRRVPYTAERDVRGAGVALRLLPSEPARLAGKTSLGRICLNR